LKSVVKSIFSDRLNAAEREAIEPSEEGDEAIVRVPSSGPGPEAELIAVEEVHAELRLRNKMLDALEEDEDKLVLLEIIDHSGKAADIAKALGMPIDEVYNRKKKIKRRLLHLKEAN
jgi:DNA-directed RNA polymerase specialized sigma24 family protein